MADITLKGGHTTTDPRLDRVPFLDDASKSYTVRDYLTAHPRTAVQRRRSIIVGPTLDQGNIGGCTGFSISHAMGSSPVCDHKVTDASAIQWYYDNQQNDAEPGGEYPGATPHYSGSTVLASMKTLQQLNFIAEYRWIGAGSGSLMSDLEQTLKYVGPVCFGTNWYNSMFTAQPNGLLEVDTTSGIAGGHAYCIHNWVHKKLAGTAKAADYLIMQQSWGTGWGTQWRQQGGFAYMLVESAEALLTEQGGEGAVPIPQKTLPAESTRPAKPQVATDPVVPAPTPDPAPEGPPADGI